MNSKSGKSQNENREQKRLKQRESLNAAFGDHMLRVSIPAVVRKHSAEVDEAAHHLEERARSVSAKAEALVDFNEEQARDYVEDRAKLVNDSSFWLKKGKLVVERLRRENLIDRPSAKRTHDELDESDQALLRERAVLAANRVKVRYGMLAHPSHARVGEAYLAAIVDTLLEPAGALVKKQGPRDKGDQANFRRRLLATYDSAGFDDDPDNVRCWCPVMGRWFMADRVKAAHIVPYSIGETNAAYPFGLAVEDGYEAIWSTENGMLLHDRVEKALDNAQIIIAPDETDQSELKLVVLDDGLMRCKIELEGPTFGDLHNHRLQFQTKARPGRRYLYLHYVISLFRRRRFDVNRWEHDKFKVKNAYVWSMPGAWVRRSIIKALAFEVGYADEVEEIVGNDNGLTNFPEAHSKEKEADISVVIRQRLFEAEMQEKNSEEWKGCEEGEEERVAGKQQ